MKKEYDVVVIGAGAIGTSVAYHLAKAGYSTAILERGDIASGSSSHCDAVDTKIGQASIDYFA